MKIAVCIPSYGDPRCKFMQSLASMLVHTQATDLLDADDNKIPVQIETFIVSSSMLTESRHRLIAEALAWDADYILCLDADHTFPHDTFCRLWSHNLPIVGANYPRRHSPTAPTAAYFDEEGEIRLLYTTEAKAREGLVEPAAHLGFGVLLINAKAFDVLQAFAETEWGGDFLPLFLFEPTENKVGMIGEDVYFFRKMKQAGIVPFVDHALSWEVGHMFETVLTNAHAVVQKDKWAEFRKSRGDKFASAAAAIEQAAEADVINEEVK